MPLMCNDFFARVQDSELAFSSRALTMATKGATRGLICAAMLLDTTVPVRILWSFIK